MYRMLSVKNLEFNESVTTESNSLVYYTYYGKCIYNTQMTNINKRKISNPHRLYVLTNIQKCADKSYSTMHLMSYTNVIINYIIL